MSKREWKPGDVAMDPKYGPVFVVEYSKPWCPASHSMHSLHVHHSNGDWNVVTNRLKPLVVIDPEDREAVERLAGFIDHATPIKEWQAALRAFANPQPPKPEEPTGLGAVVEDAEGKRWVRVGDGRLWSREEPEPIAPLMGHYADIAAVRVLSPGVEVES